MQIVRWVTSVNRNTGKFPVQMEEKIMIEDQTCEKKVVLPKSFTKDLEFLKIW